MCSPRNSDEKYFDFNILMNQNNSRLQQDLKWSLNNVVRYKYSLSPASNWFASLYYIIASSIELILQIWPLAI